MSAFMMEFKYAWRCILGQPGLSALVVAVLGIGLGCAIFMFMALNSFILAPLPFAHSEQLHELALQQDGAHPDDLQDFPESQLAPLRRALHGKAQIAAFNTATVNLTEDRAAERYDGSYVSWNLFELLGAAPRIGRTFAAADDQPGANLTVVLSDALWKSRYAGDPNIIGRKVRANSEDAIVIGVMGADFGFPRLEKIWLPIRAADVPDPREERSFRMVARSVDGSSAQVLRGGLDAWLADARAQDPERYRHLASLVRPIGYLFVNTGTRRAVNVLFAAVIFVLLIACANAANLLLTHGAARQRELALRAAIGARRSRLAMQGLLHSLLLALMAAGLGVLVAWFAHGWLERTLDNSEGAMVGWLNRGMDARVVVFVVAMTLLAAVVTGLMPALRAGRIDLNEVLRDAGRGASGGRFGRISRMLVVVEIVLSCVLLLSTGSMINAARALATFDVGADSSHVLTARIGLFPNAYPDEAGRVKLMERLVERLRAEPGVIDASIGTALPGFTSEGMQVSADGVAVAGQDFPEARYGAVEDHYLSAYRIRLERGRAFDSRDSAAGEPVAIVDRSFADKLWPGQDPLGRQFHFAPSSKTSHKVMTVVGVIARLHLDQLDDHQQPSFLIPLRQQPARFASLAVRVEGEAKAFAPRLAQIAREVDADTPLYWVRSMDEALEYASFGPRVLAKLFCAFGAVALLLAAAGLYGLIAVSVSSRTREIGVRRTLGATDSSVLNSVLGRSAWQVGLGLLLGLGLGIPFAQILGKVSELIVLRPSTVLAVLAVLVISALFATVLPARRALAVHPSVALRHE